VVLVAVVVISKMAALILLTKVLLAGTLLVVGVSVRVAVVALVRLAITVLVVLVDLVAPRLLPRLQVQVCCVLAVAVALGIVALAVAVAVALVLVEALVVPVLIIPEVVGEGHSTNTPTVLPVVPELLLSGIPQTFL
jgi:hypothetical protein